MRGFRRGAAGTRWLIFCFLGIGRRKGGSDGGVSEVQGWKLGNLGRVQVCAWR